MLESVLTVSEVAKVLGTSTRFVRAQCERGKLTARKTDDGVWLILKYSINNQNPSK